MRGLDYLLTGVILLAATAAAAQAPDPSLARHPAGRSPGIAAAPVSPAARPARIPADAERASAAAAESPPARPVGSPAASPRSSGSPAAGPSGEQPPAPPRELTIPQAIEQALARNRDLAVVRREVDVSRGRLEQARLYPFNPELILDGDVGRGTGREVPQDRRGLGGGSVGLEQIVEIQGQRGIRTRAAGADLARSTWAAREAERQVVAETTKAFSALRLAQERVRLAEDVVALVTELKTTAETLVGAGEVGEVDALRATVELRRAVNRLTLEHAARATAARALALLIGASQDSDLTATGPLQVDLMAGPLDELLALARRHRPDLKAAEAALDAAREVSRLVQAERFLPAVRLWASYLEGLDFDSKSRQALFGVSVPLPIWNRRQGDLRAAESEVRRWEAERERILAQIDREVPTAFQQLQAARRVLDEYVSRIVPGQEETTKLIRQGYRLGEFRLTDALLAQRDVVDTRTAYLDAVAAANEARADLRRAAGTGP